MRLKAIWADNTPYSKFMISVGIILISAVFFTLVSTVLAMIFFQVSMPEMQNLVNDLDNPKTIGILKLVQGVSSFGTFIVPPLLIAYLFDPDPKQFLSLNKKIRLIPAIYVIVAMLVSVPLINFLNDINSFMKLPEFMKGVESWMRESEDKATAITKAFLEMPSIATVLANLIVIALIPAIGEELLFRGLIQRIFTNWARNIHIGVWISAILFSAMHMQFYGFIPRMMLGVLLGYLLAWSGSLWLPILAHFVNNTAAVIFTALLQNHYTSLDPDKIGTGEVLQLSVIISILVTAVLLFMIHRVLKKAQLVSVE